MTLNEILNIQPQTAAIEFGPEPSLLTLIEEYYKPHFPDNYKHYAMEYVQKLEETLKDTGLEAGDLVEVIFDAHAGTDKSFKIDGVAVGDIGVIKNLDEGEDFPVNVTFNDGKEIAFLFTEVRKL